jgi:hypothetical protein
VLPDAEAARIEEQVGAADRQALVRWVWELLENRKARSALLQGQARRVAYLRKRLKQAAEYLDSLALEAQEECQAPWPGKQLCPHCGAPAAMVRAELRQQGHAVVHDHPDGQRCEDPRSQQTSGERRRGEA